MSDLRQQLYHLVEEEIEEAGGNRVTKLFFDDVPLGVHWKRVEDWDWLAARLERLPRLKELHFSDQEYLNEQLISRVLTRLNLRCLSLRGGALGSTAEIVTAIVHMSDLQELDLSENELDDPRQLERAFRHMPKLTKVELSENNFSAIGALGDSLRPLAESLTHLDLSYNRIRSAPHLIKAMAPLTKLRTLTFDGNWIHDIEPFRRIVKEHPRLREVSLKYTDGLELDPVCSEEDQGPAQTVKALRRSSARIPAPQA